MPTPPPGGNRGAAYALAVEVAGLLEDMRVGGGASKCVPPVAPGDWCLVAPMDAARLYSRPDAGAASALSCRGTSLGPAVQIVV